MMKQYNWTYVDDRHVRYKVTLMHSVTKGYLLVLVNGKVSLIRYQVFDSTSYSLFLGEELCTLTIERKADRFVYDFRIDKKVDTPRNRARNKRKKLDLRKTAFFFAGVLLFTLMFAIIFSTCQRKRHDEQVRQALARGQAFTEAVISQDPNKRRVHYFYQVAGKTYQDALLLPRGQEVKAAGLPVRNHFQFRVAYALENPQWNQLHLDQPTATQRKLYAQMIANEWKTKLPAWTTQAIYCVLDASWENQGMESWGVLYDIIGSSHASSRLDEWAAEPENQLTVQSCF